jgi:hypothetical protein
VFRVADSRPPYSPSLLHNIVHPHSGPMRFSFVQPTTATSTDSGAQGVWTYARDEVTLGALLDREIRSVLVSEVGQEEADAWEGAGVE